MVDLLTVDPDSPGVEALRRAGELILSGQTVALPTDTLYGLCAKASDAEAVRRLFKVKGRTEEKGVPVLIGHREQLSSLAGPVSARARGLMDSLWPGPLTLVLPASANLPPELLGENSKGVAIRMPGQALCRSLALAVGPFAATSANRPGEPPLGDPNEIASIFSQDLPLILDGGLLSAQLPSTVVDARGDRPQLIREGQVAFEAIVRAWERMG